MQHQIKQKQELTPEQALTNLIQAMHLETFVVNKNTHRILDLSLEVISKELEKSATMKNSPEKK